MSLTTNLLSQFHSSGQPRPSTRAILCALLAGIAWLGTPVPSQAVEPNFGYYDDVPPIEQNEIDGVVERTVEARKRLKYSGPAAAVNLETIDLSVPIPSADRDERDEVPGIDLKEVEELHKAFQEMQSAGRREQEKPPSSPEPASSEPSSPPKKDEAQGDIEREMRSLTERMNALERVLVGTEERPGLSGLIGGWTRHNGFFLMSSGGDFFIRFGALLQSDFRSFPGGQDGTNPGVRPSTFILQRARPTIHFRLWRYLRGYMTPDLGNGFTDSPLVQGRVQVPDAFAEWDYYQAFRIRFGKFKSPVGLEMFQATQNLSFMERSLTRNLLPNRDLGLMVWGTPKRGLLEYQLGVFNGVPNANFYQESRATSSGKTLEARVFTRPFLESSIEMLRGFGIGAGMSWGSIRDQSGQDPMQTETFSYTFFQYRSNVTSDGDRTRISPQAAWYYRRVGLLGQYVRSTQHLSATATGGTGPDRRTTHDAWSAQASLFLTEDTATFGHVEPRRPFNVSKGEWGAWELAVRYSQLNIDQDTYAFNLADPTVNVLRAKSSTVGVNWYLNSNIRITGNFVHTDFTGATPAYRAASREDGLMFRTQLTF